LIRVEDLAAGYGSKTLFSRLSFSVDSRNSPLVLLGSNGSGKSTLLRILAGFRKPDAGSVHRDVRSCAWLPQQYRVELEIPVLEFVSMCSEKPGAWFSSRPADARNRSLAALRKLGVERLADQNCMQLSGGEWQLACMAQMLVQEARIWLLDEPTASLDIGYKKKILQLLWEEAGAGRTVVFSTHDLPFLPESGGSLLMMENRPEILENHPGLKQKLMQSF
jgi:ABC-type cobalamin/Fe3+-siderophores transport system ATPase subunit